eukprot:TRINITY_DN6769_c0_g1_i1.p1 TRINITY_DN6769_c0_g1~~TRINITY_DN6769_c0_g1_i1.p1  ORF type:complete len:255 (-),score=52.56 TRINITY_DN6769_c0_g1_i1:268-1032(-)
MAASSNKGEGGAAPSNPNNNNKNSNDDNNSNAANGVSAYNSSVAQRLKHNSGLATEWTPQEQAILEENLPKFSGDQNILKYVKIATLLPEKSVRDVALRCRWMTKKENGKRRKTEEQNSAKKSKDKKEKTGDSSAKASVPLVARSTMPMYPQPLPQVETDDGISYEAIGGKTGQLLQQNAHVFSKIIANLQSYQIQENIDLFSRTRSNIVTILNEMNDMPGIMSQMPPLPVGVNEQLADSILPKLPQVSTPLPS